MPQIEEYWQDRIDARYNPRSIRIDGVQYWLGDETDKGVRGFGGSYYKIKHKNGLIIETTNLWYNGEIPSECKRLLPDNAEFIMETE